MQKVLILICSLDENGASAAGYRRYARSDQEVTVRRLDTLFVAWDGQELSVADSRGEINLADFDVVHIAGWKPQWEMAFAVVTWLKAHNMPFVGKTILDLYPISKVGEMVRLVSQGVPYPKSYYTGDVSKLVQLFDWAHEQYGLEFPVVVKASTASKGEDNHLVRSRAELEALHLNADLRYLMQEAIPNNCDYRALVMGGKIALVIKRTRQDDTTHLNNTSQGADAEVVDVSTLPEHFNEVVMAAATSLGQDDIAGVDVLVDSRQGDLYILEVNKTPHMAIGAPNVIEQKLGALYEYLHNLA